MAKKAFIREQDCIGCAKCLQVCPTDAIVGAAKFLHVVLEEDCVGCERCLPACPVDCIDLIPMNAAFDPKALNHEERRTRKKYIQFLTNRRIERLAEQAERKKAQFLALRNKMNDHE